MPRISFSQVAWSIVLFVLATTGARAAEPATGMRERVLRMTEFLDTMLPGTLGAKNLTLHFTPKFSDLRDEDYIRYPVELRYGLNDRLDLTGGIVPFGPNPIQTGRDHRWGPGELKFGARYDWASSLGFFDQTTFGLETRFPLGKPPTGLNDHYSHLKPILAAARTLRIWPNTTFYTNLSYDRSIVLTRRGLPPPDVIRRNIIDVWPGLLFNRSEFGYFGEYRFSHISGDLDWHLAHEIRFGTIWDIPLDRSEPWKLPGKWQVELAYKIKHEEGRDTAHGIFARVNWRTTLREVFGPTPPRTVRVVRDK